MDNVTRKTSNGTTVISGPIASVGYRTRSSILGEENEIVRHFVTSLIDKYKTRSLTNLTVFIEPQLETGYPDIVLVYYRYNNEITWEPNRHHLGIVHFKILFEIDKARVSSTKKLADYLGYSESELRRIVIDLHESSLIFFDGQKIKRLPYRKYFVIKKIISIEAKLEKWSEAMSQANKNIRFSSESYILMRKSQCSDIIKERCQDLGIGIYLVNGRVFRIAKAEKRPLPNSYTTLLFNEWVQRIDKHIAEDEDDTTGISQNFYFMHKD